MSSKRMERSMSLESGVTPRRLNHVVLPDPGRPMASTTTPLGCRGEVLLLSGMGRGCSGAPGGGRRHDPGPRPSRPHRLARRCVRRTHPLLFLPGHHRRFYRACRRSKSATLVVNSRAPCVPSVQKCTQAREMRHESSELTPSRWAVVRPAPARRRCWHWRDRAAGRPDCRIRASNRAGCRQG